MYSKIKCFYLNTQEADCQFPFNIVDKNWNYPVMESVKKDGGGEAAKKLFFLMAGPLTGWRVEGRPIWKKYLFNNSRGGGVMP